MTTAAEILAPAAPHPLDATGDAHPNLWVRWFVQYNPLFTASALLVLAGVFLVSRGVAAGSGAVLVVDGVLDVYQWLLIGTAALLYRRLLERRPAVILGVIALVFLVDPTFELSTLSSRDDAFVAVVVFVVSFAAKLQALAWAFRLRLSTTARWLPVLVVAALALLQALRAEVIDGDVALGLAALVAFVVAAATSTFRVKSTARLSEEGVVVFARVKRAAVVIGVAGAAYQLVNVGLEDPVVIGVVVVAVLAGRAAAAKDSGAVWGFAAAAFVASFFCGKDQLHLTWLLVGAGCALASRQHAPRFFTVGVALAAVVGYDLTRLTPAWWIPVVGVALIAWTLNLVARRGWSSLPPLVVAGVCGAARCGVQLPTEGFSWGVGLVVAGFVFLPLGVVAHRKLSRLVDAEDALRDLQAQATAQSPTSPAAF